MGAYVDESGELMSSLSSKKMQNPEYVLDPNVQKNIEQLKAHII